MTQASRTGPTTAAGALTEAGRYFTEHFLDMRPHDILSVEAEARTSALREARAAVEQMPCYLDTCTTPNDHPVNRRAVLAALDALEPKP
jgi:hypothetical protein